MKNILLILVLIPFIASAVWWNPSTWFQKDVQIIEEIVEVPVEVEKIVIKEVIVEVDNPEQQKEIDELRELNNILTEENQLLENKIESKETSIKTIKDAYLEAAHYISEYDDLLESCIDNVDFAYNLLSTFNRSYSAPLLPPIQSTPTISKSLYDLCRNFENKRYSLSTREFCESVGL